MTYQVGDRSPTGQATFSLSIFPVVPSPGGPRKLPIEVRVYGPASKADDIRRLAAIVAKMLDAGTWGGRKTISVTSAHAREMLKDNENG